jgi:type II secretory pathway pseudopilin PulG
MARGAFQDRRAFTLIELLVSILVIFLLMALIIGGIRMAGKFARSTADAATVEALGQGLKQFKQQFGFVPPLVKDGYATGFPQGPLNTGGTQVLVYSVAVPAELAFLRPATQVVMPTADPRFSLYSIPYYILGALDIDGLPGPGMRTPKRDGSFEKSGQTFSPFFDVGKNARAMFETQPGTGRIELRDNKGVAYRYYRWRPLENVVRGRDLNIPWVLGDPENNPDFDARLKNAECAIVAAGANGVFGDEDTLRSLNHPQALSDDQFREKLGISGSGPITPDERKIAMADNIIVPEGAK